MAAVGTTSMLVFEQTDFNRRHKNISVHPINFATILKLSKSQLTEKAFKDGVIDQLYELLLDFCNVFSHEIGFPELILPALLQLKEFTKKCKVANYCRQMKQIVEKVQESSDVVVERRKNVTFTVSDTPAIEEWQKKLQAEGTPITKYYKSWRQLRDRELQHEIAGKDRLLDHVDIPTIDRSKFKQKATEEDRKEFAALFEGQSDSEDDDSARFMLKEERPKKTKKAATDDDDSDQYSDLDSDEMEQLAGSAEESESGDDGPENDPDSGAVNDAEDGNESDNESDDDGGGDGEDKNMDEDQEDVVEDLELSSDEED